MSKGKGEIILFVVAILWGLGFIATAMGIERFGVFEILAMRFWIASILLSITFFKHIKNIDMKNFKFGFFVGTLIFLGFTFQTFGVSLTTPSKNAFLTSTNVVIVPLIGYLFYKRKLDIYNLIGALLTLLGIGFISYNPNFSVNLGDVLTLICAVFFALHIFYTSEFLKKGADVISISIVQMFVVAIYSTIALCFTGSNIIEVFHSGDYLKPTLAILYSGIFSTALCYYLQTLGQQYTSESKAAIIMSTESIFGAIFSVILLHEVLPTTTIIGCVIVFIAVLFTELKPKNIFKKPKLGSDEL